MKSRLVSSALPQGTNSPSVIEAHQQAQGIPPKEEVCVGQGRPIHIARLIGRRIKYIARFVLWTARHRSTAHVRWVLAFEGTSWN